VRLAIADPPYLGRGARLYGPNHKRLYFGTGPKRGQAGRSTQRLYTTTHPDAAQWDDPATHHALIAHLNENFDGWALAAAADSLAALLPACPTVRVAVWVKPSAVPSARLTNAWEPVLVRIPPGRGARVPSVPGLKDVLTKPSPNAGHVGSKPAAWTRWVLDMLGYDQDADSVVDMFPGSGAVGAEVAQLTFEPTVAEVPDRE
jgi:hypothetical protein